MNDSTIKKNNSFRGRFWIDRDAHVFLGPGRIELLEKINSGNSIAEAARQLGMGYKTAWDMLNGMNQLSDEPLVIRTKGGKNGGGTVLTEYGKKMITVFRSIEREYYAMLFSLEQRYSELSQGQNTESRYLLRTSARNQLLCTIQALEKNGHHVIVKLNLGNKQFLYAQLTQVSIDEMGISIGQQVVALIKAPSIHLYKQLDAQLPSIEGTIKKIHQDEEGSFEIEISLQSGQKLIATLEINSHESVILESSIYVAIDPKQVILATF